MLLVCHGPVDLSAAAPELPHATLPLAKLHTALRRNQLSPGMPWTDVPSAEQRVQQTRGSRYCVARRKVSETFLYVYLHRERGSHSRADALYVPKKSQVPSKTSHLPDPAGEQKICMQLAGVVPRLSVTRNSQERQVNPFRKFATSVTLGEPITTRQVLARPLVASSRAAATWSAVPSCKAPHPSTQGRRITRA